MNKKLIISLLTILIIGLGFIRGYLFGNINWIYKTLTENRKNQARHEFHSLLEWSPNSILLLKWTLTFLFFGLFWLLTNRIIHFAFKNKNYDRIVSLMYLGMLGVSGLLYLSGLIWGYSLEFYFLVRTVMGMAQSFMPLMILFIIIKFLPQSSSK